MSADWDIKLTNGYASVVPPSISTTSTVEGWFRIDTYTSPFSTLWCMYANPGTYLRINSSGTIQFYYGGSPTENFTTTNTITDHLWHHIAVTINGTALVIYVDGSIFFSTTMSGNVTLSNGTQYFFVGSQNGSSPLTGAIEEIRVWNTTLSQTTIQAWKNARIDSTHPNYANLLIYWQMWEKTGSSLSNALSVGPSGALITPYAWEQSAAGLPYPWWNWLNSSGFTARYTLSAVLINGKVYCVNGATTIGFNNPSALNQMYDPSTNTWTSKAVPPISTFQQSADTLNGLLYMTGGGLNSASSTGATYSYDPTSNSWTTQATRPFNTWGHSFTAIGGSLISCGGYDVSTLSNVTTAMTYSPSSNSWTTSASLPQAVQTHTANYYNQVLYLVTGEESPGFLTAILAYNVAGNSWSVINPPSPPSLELCSTVVVGQRLYVMAGSTAHNTGAPTPISTTQVYDILTNTWSSFTAPGLVPVAGAGAIYYNGNFLLFGGASSSTAVTNIVQQFTPTLAAPNLVSPTNGSTQPNPNVTFTWGAVVSATGYTIQVATDTGFTNIVGDGNYPTTSATEPNLPVGSNLYWRVQATGSLFPGPWSSTWSLLVQLPLTAFPDFLLESDTTYVLEADGNLKLDSDSIIIPFGMDETYVVQT